MVVVTAVVASAEAVCMLLLLLLVVVIVVVVDLQWAGWSRDQIPKGTRFSAPIQTSPWAHPASYTMDGRSLPGVKQPSVSLTTHPNLVPSLKKEKSYTSTLPLGIHGLF